MTKRELIILSSALVLTALVLHLAEYVFFHNAHDILFYLVAAIAFLPVQVLFLTLLVDRVLRQREADARRHKMNMVIGVFFSDLGRPLLALFRPMLDEATELCLPGLQVKTSETDLQAIVRELAAKEPKLRVEPASLQALKDLLKAHEPLLLQLLANPVLMEHECFTDALWAIQHLQEELAARPDLTNLPRPDMRHLQGDSERAYGRLLREWLQYLMHLKRFYPYLFSFEVRADPLAPERRIEVTET
jgi:hypothetical protein